MPMELADQVVLVTGGGRGLGRACAELCGVRGAVVAVADIDAATAEECVRAIQASGGRAMALSGDVGDRATFMRIAADAKRAYGRLDAIVNAAMWIRYDPLRDIRETEFDRMVAVGLKAPVWAAQALVENRDPARSASLVNFSSPAADQGYPNTAVYAAIKGAITTLTRTLAVELGPQKIRVNAVTPGAIPTPGARAIVDDAGYELRRRKTPLGRLGREGDIASAVAFLISAEADFINGAILHVDGGLSITAG